MKVLITGKNGQVGSSLVLQFEKMPEFNVLALGHTELDITNAEQVTQIFNEFKPTIVINAAAYTAVDKAESEIKLADAINHQGPKNLADAAKENNAALIHISTDYVFDGVKQDLYDENDLTIPLNTYGKTKHLGELAIESSCEKYIIIRTSWVFGENGNNFVKTMLKLGSDKKMLNIVNDQYGGPTYVGDIVDAILKIINRIKLKANIQWGIYHYSGSPIVSWFEFAQIIFKQANEQKVLDSQVLLIPIATTDFNALAIRPKNSGLNCNKIKKVFDIEQSNWKEALKKIGAFDEGI